MSASTKPWKSACAKDACDRPGVGRRPAASAALGLFPLRLIPCFVALAGLILAAVPARAQNHAAAQAHADIGFALFYNLDLDQAAAQYQQAVAAAPEQPDYWVGLAHARMFQHLRAIGRLDAQIYGASNDLVPKPPSPDPQFERNMWQVLSRARAICEKRLAANPADVDAHYGLGLAYAVESNFHVNARGKPRDALGPATKARNHHQRVRELDPANRDADFVIGAYEYAIGSVPAAFRWILYLIGHSGSKSGGLERMENVADHGSRAVSPARATLAYFYAREKQFGRSRAQLAELLRSYPRNHIFAMEAAMSFAREGNHPAAAAAYEEIARKFEARAPGFEHLSAPRLYFQIAVMHELAKQYPQAAAAYEKALAALAPLGDTLPASAKPAPPASGNSRPASDWTSPLARLRAHTLLRLGSISLTLGRAARARPLLEEAAASPFSEVAREARSRLNKL